MNVCRVTAPLAFLCVLLATVSFSFAQQKTEGGHSAMEKAQEAHPQGAEGEAGAAHEANPIFPMAIDLGIFTLAFFLILHFFLRKHAWLPILSGLNKRQQSIELAAEEAKMARVEAEQARQEFETRQKEAYAQIPRILEEARRKADSEREAIVNSAMAEIQKERQELRQEVENAKEELRRAMREQLSSLAALISSKAIGRSLNEEEHRQFIGEALAEMGEAT